MTTILICTTAHPPGDVRVAEKFARSFRDRGWQVDWIGPRLREQIVAEPMAGVRYSWVPESPGKAGRLLGGLRLGSRARRAVTEADWIYCPDPDAVPTALRLRKRLGSKVIFDIHEAFHGAHLESWLGPLHGSPAENGMQRWISGLCERVDVVTSPSPSVLSAYSEVGVVTLNTVRAEFASRVASARAADFRADRGARPLRVMHGKLDMPNRGSSELRRAIEQVATRRRTAVHVVALGSAAELAEVAGEAAPLAIDARTTGFELMDPVPYEQMPEVLAACDAGVIGYTGEAAAASLGNRTFEFMAAGIPLLAPIESPLIARIIEEHDCGIVYSNSDPATLADALVRLLDDPERAAEYGANGRAAFLEKYAWEAQFEGLLAEMDRVS